MKKIYRCIKCGKMCEDNYPHNELNDYNIRVWCNDCVDEINKKEIEYGPS